MAARSLPIDGEPWLLLGPPKCGKSSMADTFPEPIAVDCDGQNNKYAYKRAKRIICRNLDQYHKAQEDVQKMTGFRTLIVDPMDRIFFWAARFICQREGVGSLAQIPWNQGRDEWRMTCKSDLETWIEIAAEKNVTLVFVAHAKHGDDGMSLVFDKEIANHLQGIVNNIGYVHKSVVGKEVKFHCDLSGSGKIEAGSRNPVLQRRGVIKNCFDEIEALFAPPEDEVKKALAELETKGVNPQKFVEFLKTKNVTEPIDVLEKATKALNDPIFAGKVKAAIDRADALKQSDEAKQQSA